MRYVLIFLLLKIIHTPCQSCPPSASRAYQKRWATAPGNHSLDAYFREGGEGEERKITAVTCLFYLKSVLLVFITKGNRLFYFPWYNTLSDLWPSKDQHRIFANGKTHPITAVGFHVDQFAALDRRHLFRSFLQDFLRVKGTILQKKKKRPNSKSLHFTR